MHFKKLIPGKYLDESDLPEPVTVKMGAIAEEEVHHDGGTERKQAMAFQGAKKKLILNITNLSLIAEWHGSEIDNWLGKEVTIFYEPRVLFGRDVVGGVRIKAIKGSKVKQKLKR